MRHYDLLVVGAGSGNMLFGSELAHLRSAVVEADRFGGTCLNRGCIPSKMLVVAADAARNVQTAHRLGVYANLQRVDWREVRDRVFGRLDPMHADAITYRQGAGIDVYTDPARFIAPKVLDIAGEQVSAEQMVLAVGSRPNVPPIPGLAEVAYHTSDTIMRIDEVPESMVIIGGGFIAAELAHVFGAFGSDITIVERGPVLLSAEDEQVAARFTDLATLRHHVLLDTAVLGVSARDGGVTVRVRTSRGEQLVEAAVLLVAAGRRPNTDVLEATVGGIALDEHGHVATDDSYLTSVPGVWSLGDAANHYQLKHMANAEVRVVQHNLLHPDKPRTLTPTLVPHAVFASPQIASVGLTEQQARERGTEFVVSVKAYADAAYGWALEDTTSFVKLIASPDTRELLGAHIIGPQASTLLHPLLQAMTLGQTVDTLARDVLYVHPALTEVVEQALLGL